MPSSIILKQIEISAHCGVTPEEQQQRQPILIDLSFQCPNQKAFLSDQLNDTVDYASIIERIRQLAQERTFSLLESFAEQICQSLFQEFPITHLKLWIRKTHPPLPQVTGSVGIHLNRMRCSPPKHFSCSPAPFLVSQLPKLQSGHVLDVATGEGRHALYLANRGFSVHGIDRDDTALATLQDQARVASISSISTEVLDLERDPSSGPNLGTNLYDVILVFFYLYRPLFPQIFQALKPGGFIVYETFLTENHHYRQHPRRLEFCLKPNELLRLLQGFRILHYEEADHKGADGKTFSYTAQALAQKMDKGEAYSSLLKESH